MAEFKTGLTLGKFAPLHKGHQELIETALNEMDKLIILIYEADETEIPLSVRARWLRNLYPQAEVLEAWDGPQQVGDTPEIKAIQEKYIIERLEGRITSTVTAGKRGRVLGQTGADGLGQAANEVRMAAAEIHRKDGFLRQAGVGARGDLGQKVVRGDLEGGLIEPAGGLLAPVPHGP